VNCDVGMLHACSIFYLVIRYRNDLAALLSMLSKTCAETFFLLTIELYCDRNDSLYVTFKNTGTSKEKVTKEIQQKLHLFLFGQPSFKLNNIHFILTGKCNKLNAFVKFRMQCTTRLTNSWLLFLKLRRSIA
jgi:hypothetical protein